jgi:uncharacterized alpha-E superfamily protein
MLSRTADHLYWMARYTERAENLARMLDVSYRMSLLPQASEVIEQSWTATLTIIGVIDAFRQLNKPATPTNMLNFMAFDRNNPASIYNCLRVARENAHAVRGTLTSEMWETTNATWLEMREIGKRKHTDAEIGDFFEWVKYRSHLAHGVTQNTMLRDESYHFTWMGTYLERADNTARILDVKYHSLLPDEDNSNANTAADYYQWSALLKSVSAFEIYRKVYRDIITPHRVAELLILRNDMPRSLHRCMTQVYQHLSAVRNSRSAETERRAGELQAALHFGRIDEIFDTGLHDYLMHFVERIRDLGERVAGDFLVSVTGD